MEEVKLERTNQIKIVGTLKDVQIESKISTSGVEYASGNATVQSVIGGETNEYEVRFYTNKLTKDGKDSKLYDSYMNMSKLVGKKVQIDGDIRENRFWSDKTNQMSSAQQLNGKFIKGVSDTTVDEASFIVGGFIVKSLIEKTNKDGDVYRYDLTLGQVNYDGSSMSTYTLHIRPEDREIINAVEGFDVGATVSLNGSLNFTVKQVTKEVNAENGFGKAVSRTYTSKISNFWIEGGSGIVDDGVYAQTDISGLISAYKAKDVEIQSKASSGAKSGSTPAVNNVDASKVSKRQASLI